MHFSGNSTFNPRSKNMLHRVADDSKLPLGMHECVTLQNTTFTYQLGLVQQPTDHKRDLVGSEVDRWSLFKAPKATVRTSTFFKTLWFSSVLVGFWVN